MQRAVWYCHKLYDTQSATMRLLPVWETEGVVHRWRINPLFNDFYQIMIL
jgi:hypothetical protein